MSAYPAPHVCRSIFATILTSAFTAAIVSSLAARPAAIAGALHESATPVSADSGVVGMFCEPSMKKTVPRNSKMLHADRKIPCDEQVVGWNTTGMFRVRADGSVEALAVPVPPCAEGDYYVWVAYPN